MARVGGQAHGTFRKKPSVSSCRALAAWCRQRRRTRSKPRSWTDAALADALPCMVRRVSPLTFSTIARPVARAYPCSTVTQQRDRACAWLLAACQCLVQSAKRSACHAVECQCGQPELLRLVTPARLGRYPVRESCLIYQAHRGHCPRPRQACGPPAAPAAAAPSAAPRRRRRRPRCPSTSGSVPPHCAHQELPFGNAMLRQWLFSW